ncbi:type II secretion system F family protein [Celeribacter sp. PS-C1]|uniref:type II secretion system F family protein n=1 Tax=Celeribacter sp. PS-C1 TaxID=2820813 RepID=UPI001C685087|nr:type II secretion system F family protein [Celeribacter sp. PS-C1]MBW6417798.1 type II secretion system F family protein [Celeribacter sp. PS-C1]
MNDRLIFLYGLIFIAALLLVETVLRILMRRLSSRKEVANRLEAVKQRVDGPDAFQELLKRRGLGEGTDLSSFSAIHRKFIGQTGLEISNVRQISYLILFALFGLFASGLFLGLSGIPQVIFSLVFAVALGVLILWVKRASRIRLFTRQLPEAIDVIVRSLNAGHPLNAAIALVSREMPDPIGSEFGILHDQMTYGADLELGMMALYDRVGAPEIQLLTVTVSVQRGTGGNLSEILENLSSMIRARLMIKRKILAISAEGRITAWIMLGFPFGLYYMIRALVPEYFDPVWESGYGTLVVTGCLIMIFFGMIIIRRLVNFDF